eukprot:gene14142-18980_t
MGISFLILLCLLLSNFNHPVGGFAIAPVLSPLHFITPDVIANYFFDKSQAAVWSAILPIDSQDSVAIFISEGISGFLGGVVAKIVSNVDGNRGSKRDSSLASAETSGAYFGVVAATKSLAQIAGLSNIFVNVLALSFAALASEIVKIRRNTSPPKKRVSQGPTMYELMKFKNPSMLDLIKFSKDEQVIIQPRMKMIGEITQVEITADITKWFVIYTFLPSYNIYNNMNNINNNFNNNGNLILPLLINNRLEDVVIIGFVAGIISQCVREQRDREIEEQIQESYQRRKRILLVRQKNNIMKQKTKNSYQFNNALRLFYDIIGITKAKNINKTKKIKFDKNNKSLVVSEPLSLQKRITMIVKKLTVDNSNDDGLLKPLPDFPLARFSRAGLECAVQLLTYEAARQYVMEVSPYFQGG